MDLFKTDQKGFFLEFYQASTEGELEEVLNKHPELADPANWFPYGDIDNNYGVVENQQASPIPALVEKITNSIDAVLMRRCYEEGIDPKSSQAPNSIEEAVEQFFPDSSDWDLPNTLREQAARIQVVADGPKLESSIIIYDDGEGQHPDDFESTFLSLLRGNKNRIPFVQGKYNMGATGALVFCGKKRYQLIGSRRFKGGPFGFTLVRRHPLTDAERQTRRSTWYEFLKIGGEIPRFDIGNGLDLGLHDHMFESGTVIKLYSYALPPGSRSVFTRDLHQSINEYLFEPALPILTVDSEDRYPDNKNLQNPLYGLKRDVERRKKYVEESFTETEQVAGVGTFKVTCYVFRARVDDRSVAETKRTVQNEFFKNGMSVLFSLNGQVHGHYTSEFITRTLKYHILKDYLLVHVDCTGLDMEFRDELFMASRDRLKRGDEASKLRELVAGVLKRSKLRDIYKRRRQSIAVDGTDADDLLRNVAKSLPLDKDLMRLLDQSLRLDRKDPGKTPDTKPRRQTKKNEEEDAFEGKRFPTFLRVDAKSSDNGTPLVHVPLGGTSTIRLTTDVEDEYLDRVDEPGDLRVELLDYRRSNGGGGGGGLPTEVQEVFDVGQSSPDAGTIRVRLSPKGDVEAGDAARVRVTLTGPGRDYDGVFWARVTEKRKKPVSKQEAPDPTVGLPQLVTVREQPQEGGKSWEDMATSGIVFDYGTVMHPGLDDEDALAEIYINLDCRVLKDYRSKQKTQEQMDIAERRFISAVYFHTLFLYAINKSRKYEVLMTAIGDGEPEPQSISDYLKDVFDSAYAEFLLNFETSELMSALE